MAAPTPQQLHRLARRPSDYARFVQTGRLPSGIVPSSPLVTLLQAIAPRDLSRMVGLTVNSRLGYGSSRQFHYAAQALRWVAPAPEVFGSFPAESFRNKNFRGPLFLEDLVASCASVPSELLRNYSHLCRPADRAAT